jgi:hypothetical protein
MTAKNAATVYANAYWPNIPPVAKSTNKPINHAVPTLHKLGARISQNMMTSNIKSGRNFKVRLDHGSNRNIYARKSDK